MADWAQRLILGMQNHKTRMKDDEMMHGIKKQNRKWVWMNKETMRGKWKKRQERLIGLRKIWLLSLTEVFLELYCLHKATYSMYFFLTSSLLSKHTSGPLRYLGFWASSQGFGPSAEQTLRKTNKYLSTLCFYKHFCLLINKMFTFSL